MATGGIFQLITNDGKQDRMLMATALLNKRLKLIRDERQANPQIADKTPTLLDIEKTHILFMNAHFKPFAAIGYEYNTVKTTSGTTTLGSQVTFSIPQFGDFFHDMLLRVKLTAPTLNREDNITTQTLDDENTGAAGRQHAPAFRWCHYPGERLMEKVSFQVNGNPLDEYSQHSYNFWREFCVSKSKMAGWNRCIGQQSVQEGHYRQPGVDLAGSSATFGAGADTGVNWSGSNPSNHRITAGVTTGPQTPKMTPEGLELFIPLLFWCNLDPRLAVPSVAIPYGQRFININLAPAAKMYGLVPRGVGNWTGGLSGTRGEIATHTTVADIELYINNIFVNPEVHDIFIRRIGFSLIRVHREQIISSQNASDSVLLNQMKWPVENLFVGMKIASYASDASYNQDRWHSFAQLENNEYEACGIDDHGGELVAQLNDATITAQGGIGNIQSITLGFADVINVNGSMTITGNPITTDWNDSNVNAGDLISVGGRVTRVLEADAATNKLTVYPGVLEVGQYGGGQLVNVPENVFKVNSCVVEAPVHTRTVDTIAINAHGIPLYKAFPGTFYDSYVPYQYGGSNINTPDNVGPMMVTFNLYPRSYQPSGHVNISRAREFYIDYVSSVISTTVLGQLVVIASALNFLLISDGSAVLRYST